MLNEVFYMVIGILFLGVQLFLNSKLQKMGEKVLSLANLFFLICNASVMFAIMWVYGSLMEHETQAAFMGIVFYGGFGIVFGIIGYRILMMRRSKATEV